MNCINLGTSNGEVPAGNGSFSASAKIEVPEPGLSADVSCHAWLKHQISPTPRKMESPLQQKNTTYQNKTLIRLYVYIYIYTYGSLVVRKILLVLCVVVRKWHSSSFWHFYGYCMNGAHFCVRPCRLGTSSNRGMTQALNELPLWLCSTGNPARSGIFRYHSLAKKKHQL